MAAHRATRSAVLLRPQSPNRRCRPPLALVLRQSLTSALAAFHKAPFATDWILEKCNICLGRWRRELLEPLALGRRERSQPPEHHRPVGLPLGFQVLRGRRPSMTVARDRCHSQSAGSSLPGGGGLGGRLPGARVLRGFGGGRGGGGGAVAKARARESKSLSHDSCFSLG